MNTDGWLVVEMLGDTARVIGASGLPKQRRSLGRTLQSTVGARIARFLAEFVEATLRSWSDASSPPEPIHRTVAVDGGVELILRPVVGPGRVPFGATLWLGSAGTRPATAPPTAVAFEWNSHTRLVELSDELPEAFVRGARYDGRRTLTAPEIFRLFEIDDSLTLIRNLLSSEPNSIWQGVARYRAASTSMGAVHLTVVSGGADDAHVWRGIVHDIDAAQRGTRDSFESVALATIPQFAANSYYVLVDVQKMRLIRWITDPLPDVQWKGMVDDRDAPHPDDVTRIFAAAGAVFTGTSDRASVAGVRLRRFGGGWIVIDGEGVLIRSRGSNDPKLGLIHMRVVGESDDLDPVPITDPGHPGIE